MIWLQRSPERPCRCGCYNRSGRVSAVLAFSLLANAALLGGLAYLFFGRPVTGPGGSSGVTPRSALAAESIEALGRVQPLGGVVSVFGPPGDRIVKLEVELGSTVSPGQVLAVLAGAEERQRSLAALDAQIAEAKALREAIRTSSMAKQTDLKVETEQAVRKADGEIKALDARIAGLKAQSEQARAERRRLSEIERSGVAVSEQERSQADLLVTQAEQGLVAAEAQRAAAVEQVRAAPEAEKSKRATIIAEAERGLAQVPLASLEASRAVAEQKILDARVKAPVAGRVVKVIAHAGDTLTQQPVLQLAATDDMAVIAEVYETDVARLKEWLAKAPGNQLAVEVDARVIGGDAKLGGTTTAGQIAPMIARNVVFALGPREDADRRVVEVEIRLDPAASKAVAEFIGLQVRGPLPASEMTAFRLALSNLLHDRGRTAVSVTGAAFAVVLIFMQLGFLGAVANTATQLYERLRFDLMLTSSEYLDLSRAGRIERTRLAQVHAAGGVADVIPISVEQALWKNPTADPARGGKRWQLTLIGLDPGRLDRSFRPEGRGVFRDAEELVALQRELARLDVVLLDRRSRPDFGNPRDMPPGLTTEVSGRRVELIGYFEIGTGFSYAGLLITNEETFSVITRRPRHQVSFGLIQLEPGQDPATAADRIRAVLPPDAQVFTREQIQNKEGEFWVRKTAVGQFFYFGVVLALFVGAIFVYQMMVADIKKRLPEYATLRAMGYKFGYLMRVVIWQAVFLAVAGYAFGVVASLGLYELTRVASKLPVEMTVDRLASVLALTVGMCVGSGLVAVRKVRTADPADLF